LSKEDAMGKLRDLMDRDLQIRGYSPNTRDAYLRSVRGFVRHWNRSPEQLTIEHVNQYQHHLVQRKVSWACFNQAAAALRFFYGVTLKKDWDITRIPYHKTGRRLPQVLAEEEVVALFGGVQNIKHRAILMTLYAGGLRVSEAAHLRVTDIDSRRMVVRIDQGKGRKDRYVPLSKQLLKILREYWLAVRPRTWLFPGQDPEAPLTRGSVDKIFRKAKVAARIGKPVSSHSLRHSYATHLLERGVNIRVIQQLLGHRSLRSTEIYTHVARTYLKDTPSPLDLLPMIERPAVQPQS
jgi:site-specific recombinase XerD